MKNYVLIMITVMQKCLKNKKNNNKILKYRHEEKSLKAPFIIEFDICEDGFCIDENEKS